MLPEHKIDQLLPPAKSLVLSLQTCIVRLIVYFCQNKARYGAWRECCHILRFVFGMETNIKVIHTALLYYTITTVFSDLILPVVKQRLVDHLKNNESLIFIFCG